VILVVGFRRRPQGFAAFLTEAAATGASVILIGDPTAVAHASQVSIWLECPLQHSLAFDSYAAPMAMVSVLADAVLGACGRSGSKRVRKITQTYERMDEVE
jgi:DNA-binding MurR/RpiR family transcriptional regulator